MTARDRSTQLAVADLVPGRVYDVELDDCCVEATLTGRFLSATGDPEFPDLHWDFGTITNGAAVYPAATPRVPLDGQVVMAVENLDGDYDDAQNGRAIADLEHGNVVTSWMDPGPGDPTVAPWDVPTPQQHRPVLDLDFPAYVVPSSTDGHCHLYLDRAMSWETYRTLLHALAAAGVLEQGYVGASVDREHTTVRLPWVKKGDELTADPQEVAPAGPEPSTVPTIRPALVPDPSPVLDPWESAVTG